MRRPDFAALARADPVFATLVRPGPNGEALLDWSDSRTLVELCRVLLRCDFGVRWTLPPHALCPTVPSRLNYLLWVEDLLGLGAAVPLRDAVVGLDIGTGASCIYPLLGTAHLGWRFVATEVDPASVLAARHNVGLNEWTDRIEVRLVEPPHAAEVASGHAREAASAVASVPACGAARAATSAEEAESACPLTAEHAEQSAERAEQSAAHAEQSAAHAVAAEQAAAAVVAAGVSAPILVGVVQAHEAFSFCVCNPPWFGAAEVPRPNTRLRPDAERCVATASELFTRGGEAGFVSRMAADSAVLRERITWYTCLLGRKASMAASLRAVRATGAAHVRTTELSQGHTSRWAVAWSFVHAAAPHATPPAKPTCKEFAPPPELTRREIRRRVCECVDAHVGAQLRRDDVPGGGGGDGDGDGDGGGDDDSGDDDSGGDGGGGGGATHDAEERLLASGTVLEEAEGSGGAVGTKRAREHGAEGAPRAAEVAFAFEVRHAPGTVRVALVAARSGGGASSAFWRLAEAVRNDVVRDTRKWRRAAAAQQRMPPRGSEEI